MYKTYNRKIISTAVGSVKRFPIPFFLIVIMFFYNIKIGNVDIYFFKINVVLINGILFFVVQKIFNEARHLSKPLTIFGDYLAALAIFLILSYVIFKKNNILSDVSFALSLFLSIFIAPYFLSFGKALELWFFAYRLVLDIIYVSSTFILISILTLILIGSVESLFEYNFGETFYPNFFIIISCFMSPVLLVVNIPRNFFSKKEITMPKFINVLLHYIILPSLYIFGIILFVYQIKMVLFWSLPKGDVSLSISCFGILSVITYLLSIPLHKKESFFFNRLLCVSMIPLLFTLSFAIKQKIIDHGMTINQEIMILILSWLTQSVVAISFLNPDEAPKIVILSLIISLMGLSLQVPLYIILVTSVLFLIGYYKYKLLKSHRK